MSVPVGSLWKVLDYASDSSDYPFSRDGGVRGRTQPLSCGAFPEESRMEIPPGSVILVAGWENGIANPFHIFVKIVLPQVCYIDEAYFSPQTGKLARIF
jgi:hypothetical protein